MSTCQAGELQRKIAGTFQSLYNSESSVKALEERAMSPPSRPGTALFLQKGEKS